MVPNVQPIRHYLTACWQEGTPVPWQLARLALVDKHGEVCRRCRGSPPHDARRHRRQTGWEHRTTRAAAQLLDGYAHVCSRASPPA